MTMSFALVLPGEAMWGAMQTGFAFELGDRLHRAGYGEQPFDLAIGSSSGSLIAAAAAAGGPFDHGTGRNGWIAFGQATRFKRFGLPANPYPGALRLILDGGLVDLEKAFHSRTRLVVTASHYRRSAARELRKDHLRLLLAGMKYFLAGENEAGETDLSRIGASLLLDGLRLFGTRYYATGPRPRSAPGEILGIDETWSRVRSVPELRRAVEASSRVPLLYGHPILDGANVLIDGVFTNNAPVELALQHGVRRVFVVTSSKKGHVFDRPVQTLWRRQLKSMFRNFERASRSLDFLPSGLRVAETLAELARLDDKVPVPAPVDIEALRRRYPRQEIRVVHPTGRIRVNRFFESDPKILGGLYDLGRDLAARQDL